MTTDQPPAGPEAMRAALRDYVAALHHAYLGAAAPLPPGCAAAGEDDAAIRRAVVARAHAGRGQEAQ